MRNTQRVHSTWEESPNGLCWIQRENGQPTATGPAYTQTETHPKAGGVSLDTSTSKQLKAADYRHQKYVKYLTKLPSLLPFSPPVGSR